jgi:hypothetical protein
MTKSKTVVLCKNKIIRFLKKITLKPLFIYFLSLQPNENILYPSLLWDRGRKKELQRDSEKKSEIERKREREREEKMHFLLLELNVYSF